MEKESIKSRESIRRDEKKFIGKKTTFIETKKEIIKPKNYAYSIETIKRYIDLVLLFSLSMNSASKILPLMFNLKRTPSINSGKLWMLKLGYYNITKKQTMADDWIYIIDHSIQMGKEKLLLILGIRAKDLPKDRALKYEDVEIIDLQPVIKSTGEIVYEQIKEASKKTGKPRAIVSDMGSDIKLGIKKFQEISSSTAHVYDLKHKIALLVKKMLERDEQWSKFKIFANFVAKKLQNSTLAGYRPPKQKEKARYMNIEDLVRWGEQISIKYKLLQQTKLKTEDEIKLESTIADIVKFKESVEIWTEMVMVFQLIERFMNIHNLQRDSYEKFYELHEGKLQRLKTEEARGFAIEILSFINKQQEVCNHNERLLHSSQIIESLFGKLKFLEKEQSKSNFTNLVLSMGAMVSKSTPDILKKALESVNVNKIKEWTKEKIGFTIQAQKKEFYKLKRAEQKLDSIEELKVA